MEVKSAYSKKDQDKPNGNSEKSLATMIAILAIIALLFMVFN